MAIATALGSVMATADAPPSAVPRIHLYPTDAIPATGPGPPVFGRYAFNTGGGSDITSLLYSRLRQLPFASAEEADVFVAFLTPHRPPFHAWTAADRAAMDALGPVRVDYMPNDFRYVLITMCRQLRNRTFMRALMPHSVGAVRRHFLITPFEQGACGHEPEFRAPHAAAMPAWVARAALGLTFDNLVEVDGLLGTPRRIQMPYLSSVRWDPSWERVDAGGHIPPWRSHEGRPLLVTFTGSLRGLPQSVRMRKALVLQCARVPNSVCVSHVAARFPLVEHAQRAASDDETATLRRALRLKRRAVFCLEPTGFSPPRKSIIDSVLSGCIPVLFYQPAQYRGLMPFFFGGWGANASVRVPPDKLLNGGLDVIQLLSDIPSARVREMQRTIATHAHRLVYGLGARGVPGDAIDTLLSTFGAAVADGRTREQHSRTLA